jgi:hypothetical protein
MARRLVVVRYSIACGLAWLAIAGAAAANLRTGAVFIADPQIHNVYGGGIKQTWVASDIATGVAQRPAELNLLSPYVLTELIERANGVAGPDGSPLIIVLGDTTNIACSSELDRYSASVEAARKPGQVVIAAHGNHDSYLMGTVNSYLPANIDAAMVSTRMPDSRLPLDASWWDTPGADLDGKTWKAICAHPDGGRPLNKGQWLARYASSLKEAGLEQLVPQDTMGEGIRFRGQTVPGSPLDALNFAAVGRWYPPQRMGKGWDLQRVSRSYLVQAVDLGPAHRLVLFDSSTCNDARGGVAFLSTNAGTHACVGQAQLEDIKRIASETTRQLVFAAHYPFEKFNEQDRVGLLEAMASGGRRWTYISAHTHAPRPLEWHVGGVELNIGSTTDWPMEGTYLEFDESIAPVVHKVRLEDRPRLKYRVAAGYQGSELCRHVDAAVLLAAMNPEDVGNTWRSPGKVMRYVRCNAEGQERGFERLRDAEQVIERRMRTEPAYRQRALEIAAAASFTEHLEVTGGDILEALGWD